MNKSFRGKLQNNTVTQIRLSTNDGLTGYKIAKFELMPTDPVADEHENVVQVFTTKNDETGTARSAQSTVDFDDPTLIAVSFIEGHGSTIYLTRTTTVFDNVIFNQDIYVTNLDPQSKSVNFYLELEQVKLSKDEATVATLKDMRAGPDTNFGP